MKTTEGRFERGGHRINRRDLIRYGSAGLAGVMLSGTMPSAGRVWAAEAADASGAAAPKAKARAVIQLWMGGGPCHIDTFDPKPNAGPDYTGPYRKPIETNVKGIYIGQKLPRLAKQADKFSIIRSMTHGIKAHETATYVMQAGTMPGGDLVYPSIGAVIALKKGHKAGHDGPLPPYIAVTTALGRFNEAGFLGPEYKPFATGGNPTATTFAVQGIVPPGGVNAARIERRRKLLEGIDTLGTGPHADPAVAAMRTFEKQAYGLIQGDAKKAFDLSEEPDELRDKYGRHKFGQSCLLARRLVERGVLFVTVNFGGWDTHKNHFERMETLLPQLDAGFSTLLEDLSDRGLLETTIVTWYGEFGRTPLIAKDPPWNGGRHHFGEVFSAVVAGGGFKGGQVVGATDNRGEHVRERPVYPWDLSASIYRLMGIDPMGRLPHPHGCVAYVTPIASGAVQSGGLLTEIM